MFDSCNLSLALDTPPVISFRVAVHVNSSPQPCSRIPVPFHMRSLRQPSALESCHLHLVSLTSQAFFLAAFSVGLIKFFLIFVIQLFISWPRQHITVLCVSGVPPCVLMRMFEASTWSGRVLIASDASWRGTPHQGLQILVCSLFCPPSH